MNTKKSFTLIELIVILGIIAILTSMLFSAMEYGFTRLDITNCKSNLRNLSGAMTNYSSDYSGKFITGKEEGSTEGWHGGYYGNQRWLNRWPTVPMLHPFGAYIGIQTSSDRMPNEQPSGNNNIEIIDQWLQYNELTACPSMQEEYKPRAIGNHLETSYAYAGLMFPLRPSWWAEPGKTLQLQSGGPNGRDRFTAYSDLDQIMFFSDLNLLMSDQSYVNHSGYIGETGDEAEFYKHITGSNTAYMDGSVRWNTPETMGRGNNGMDQILGNRFGAARFWGHRALTYHW